MLAVVSEQNRLAMATVFCREQQRGENVFPDETGTVAALSSEVAKAPCKMEAYRLKGKSRDALVRLLNKSGVPLAAQRMAFDVLMKLVRREAGKFSIPLFSKVLHAMLERRDSTVVLEHFINKYLTQADFRYHTLLIMHGLARKCVEEGALKQVYRILAALTGEAALVSEQKAALNKHLLEQLEFHVSQKLELADLGDSSSRGWQNKILHIPRPSAEEEDFGCKANAVNRTIEEPEKQTTQEDISSMMVSAARGRQNEPNNVTNNVKAAGAKKKASEEDEPEDDDEDEGGGESGGDEGDSDDPGQEDEGGNEEEEDEEEEVDEEDDEEDEQQEQGPNVINNSNANPSGGLDEEDEDEESDDGGVEDEDDEHDEGAGTGTGTGTAPVIGGAPGQDDDEEDDEDDEDDETAPPNKKLKK